MEINTARVDLDVMIHNRIVYLKGKTTDEEFCQRLEELLWLRDQVKQIPYSYISTTHTGDAR